MQENHLLETNEIDENDWDKTPVSVKNLVLKLFGEIEKLKKRVSVQGGSTFTKILKTLV